MANINVNAKIAGGDNILNNNRSERKILEKGFPLLKQVANLEGSFKDYIDANGKPSNKLINAVILTQNKVNLAEGKYSKLRDLCELVMKTADNPDKTNNIGLEKEKVFNTKIHPKVLADALKADEKAKEAKLASDKAKETMAKFNLPEIELTSPDEIMQEQEMKELQVKKELCADIITKKMGSMKELAYLAKSVSADDIKFVTGENAIYLLDNGTILVTNRAANILKNHFEKNQNTDQLANTLRTNPMQEEGESPAAQNVSLKFMVSSY